VYTKRASAGTSSFDTIKKSNKQAKQLSLHLLSTIAVNMETKIAP